MDNMYLGVPQLDCEFVEVYTALLGFILPAARELNKISLCNLSQIRNKVPLLNLLWLKLGLFRTLPACIE